VSGIHGRVKDVFKSGQLRDGFLTRRPHDLMGAALGKNAPAFENEHLVPESKHLFPAVRDIENGDAMRFIPGAQIIEDA